MACREIDQMRREVCDSLRGGLDSWETQLQMKWGDPSVYQQQQEERLRQDAKLVYDLSRRNTELLSEAYATQAQKIRENHNERIKRHNYPSSATRPESEETTPSRSRTRAPPRKRARNPP